MNSAVFDPNGPKWIHLGWNRPALDLPMWALASAASLSSWKRPPTMGLSGWSRPALDLPLWALASASSLSLWKRPPTMGFMVPHGHHEYVAHTYYPCILKQSWLWFVEASLHWMYVLESGQLYPFIPLQSSNDKFLRTGLGPRLTQTSCWSDTFILACHILIGVRLRPKLSD